MGKIRCGSFVVRVACALSLVCSVTFPNDAYAGRPSPKKHQARPAKAIPGEFLVTVDPATLVAQKGGVTAMGNSPRNAFMVRQEAGRAILLNLLQDGGMKAMAQGPLAGPKITGLRATPDIFSVSGLSDSQVAKLRSAKGVTAVSQSYQIPLDLLGAGLGGAVSLSGSPEVAAHPQQWAIESTAESSPVFDSDLTTRQPGVDVDIDGRAAWNIADGDGIVVAVVDTGVEVSQPNLSPNVYVNFKEKAGNGVDDDANGFIDDYTGWSSVSGGDVKDLASHGTHVAGIIAAAPRSPSQANGFQITGVAHQARILPVRASLDGASFTSPALVDAYYYVLAQKRAGVNIKVLNLSIGGRCDVMSEQEKAALKAIGAEGVTIVAAAGNESSNNDTVAVCPANLDIPGLISVGAIDPEGNYAGYSNFGSKVTIAAPGTAILSTVTREVTELLKQYYGIDSTSFFMDGTSMAAPVVSGIAALMYSTNPLLSPAEVKTVLVETVKMKSAKYPTRSLGLVSAAGAIKRARESVVSGTITALGQPLPKVKVTMKSSLGSLETMTNDRGRFFFVRPPIGVKVALSFAKELFTFPADVSSVNDVTSNPPSFTISAERETRTVSGQVTVRGSGISGVTVSVTAQFPDSDQFRQSAKTDSNGRYSIRVPYKATYYLFTDMAGLDFGNQDIARTADADQVINIEGTPKAISIKGAVGLDGGPAMRFSGTAKVTGTVYGKSVSLTAPVRGARFEFYSSELLSGATYTITVTSSNPGLTSPAPVTVTAAGNVTVGLTTSVKK